MGAPRRKIDPLHKPYEQQKKDPTFWSPEVVKKLEEAFAIDATVAEACYYADIDRQTYYNHVSDAEDATQEQKELFDRFARLRERPVLIARQTVVKALDKDPELSLKYLERKRRLEFSTRLEEASERTINITFVNKVPRLTSQIVDAEVVDAKKDEPIQISEGELYHD